MSWVRIHDGALSHPKVVGIFTPTDPFHLWVWGLTYSQAHLTDGQLPADAMPKGSDDAAQVLVVRKLWHRTKGGFRIHDFLDWNDSKQLVTKKRTEAKARMRSVRDRSSREPTANDERTSREVLRGLGKRSTTRKEEPSESTLPKRAGRLTERYRELYSLHRNGAQLRLMGNSLEFQEALSLCRIWDDAHLEKLATLVLKTDDEFISRTDRSFKIFALKASWADDILKAWEAKHGVNN